MDWSEMTLDLGHLLACDDVVDEGLEATLLVLGSCHILGILATHEKDVETRLVSHIDERREEDASTRAVFAQSLPNLEGDGVDDPAGAILGGGTKHAEVLGKAEGEDWRVLVDGLTQE